MKKLVAIAICAVMVMSMSLTAFAANTTNTAAVAKAGKWDKDAKGWKWDNGDGTYFKGGWMWIDSNKDGKSECYYFDDNGYILVSTTTPDGYTVNADGAWIINQIVQYLTTGSTSTSTSSTNEAGPETGGSSTAEAETYGPAFVAHETTESGRSQGPTGKDYGQYVGYVSYNGVDGNESVNVVPTFNGITIEVVSKRPSSQLTSSAADSMYGSGTHSAEVQGIADTVLLKAGETVEITETVKSSDGAVVYQRTYYGIL